ncbi:hypothetical protein APUTEX25_005698, partial [Auxenochlorella protothecoides]
GDCPMDPQPSSRASSRRAASLSGKSGDETSDRLSSGRPRRQRRLAGPLDGQAFDAATPAKRPRLRRASRRRMEEDRPEKSIYDKLLNRARHQLSRIRQEQALVDAYAADGWRGAAREKVRPLQEIQRAKDQIRRCREIVRECVRTCEEAEGDTPIPASCFDEEGELDSDAIFCAKCGNREADDDNDIVLCDGPCNRAYHCKCIVPPLDVSTLTEDEGWLCPACDHKVDILSLINDEFDTEYGLEDGWQQILEPGSLPASDGAEEGEAVAVGEGGAGLLVGGADLPSEDEEDSDFEGLANSSAGVGPEDPEAQTLVVEGRRRRAQVDYRALHAAMFGTAEAEDGSGGEDEVWSPRTQPGLALESPG